MSQSGLAAITADPARFLAPLFGPDNQVTFEPSCGGSTPVCCPGGVPSTTCGPLELDVAVHPGDAPRLVLSPVQGASRVDVTVRTRAKTLNDIPVTVPLVGTCGMRIDTTPGSAPDIEIKAPLNLSQDLTAGTTRVTVGDLTINGLTSDDVELVGGFGCTISDFGLSSFLGILKDQLAGTIKSRLEESICKTCPDGDVAVCGPFATSCTDGVCLQGDQCVQELGPNGRLSAATLFGGAPPGNAGALDLYEVAGGYATTNNNGVALGVLGGEVPAGTAHDRCGPPASPPPAAAVPQSAFFQGNVRPDTSEPFDVAIGVHVSQAEQFAFAAYEGGALCPTLETKSLPSLTSTALLPVAPSLDGLTHGERPVWVGFRPQSPPTVSLGSNTFDGGVVSDPLVSLAFEQAELDVFALVQRQPLRVATVVADLNVPLGAVSDVPGTVTLVPGPLPTPTNVSVKNNEPLLESSESLKGLAPMLEDAVVPELIRRVGPIPLPVVGGFPVTPSAITSVDGESFIAVFGDLFPLSAASTTLPRTLPPASHPSPPVPGIAPPSNATSFGVIVIAALGLSLLVAWRKRSLRVLGPVTLAIGALVLSAQLSCRCGAGEVEVPDAGNEGAPDGGATNADAGVQCDPAPCAAGELTPKMGAWNSVAAGARTVIATYDETYGDAVLVELTGSDETKRVIDGLPNAPPTHAPDGYRGGIELPGPDVGAWPSIALAGDRVRVAYQDRDRGAVRFAAENADGDFVAQDVDVPASGASAGAYASLALDADSVPAIAYVVSGLPGDDGTRMTELRFARANTAAPAKRSDWTTTVVASAPGTCAGLCGSEVCVAPELVGENERCVTPTNDCTDACGADQACVAGACRAIVPAAAAELPSGTGLYARLLALTDGRFVIVYYDSTRTALIAAVETASGSGDFTEVVLDGDGATDRGAWAAGVLDAAGIVHVAYVDGLTHQVFALQFEPGSAPTAPEMVDDGMRTSDRPHWVGAGLAAWMDGTTFRVAYQDALNADLVTATRGQSGWTRTELVTGPGLDGFAIAAPASGEGPLVWNRIDPHDPGTEGLTILPAP